MLGYKIFMRTKFSEPCFVTKFSVLFVVKKTPRAKNRHQPRATSCRLLPTERARWHTHHPSLTWRLAVSGSEEERKTQCMPKSEPNSAKKNVFLWPGMKMEKEVKFFSIFLFFISFLVSNKSVRVFEHFNRIFDFHSFFLTFCLSASSETVQA